MSTICGTRITLPRVSIQTTSNAALQIIARNIACSLPGLIGGFEFTMHTPYIARHIYKV